MTLHEVKREVANTVDQVIQDGYNTETLPQVFLHLLAEKLGTSPVGDSS